MAKTMILYVSFICLFSLGSLKESVFLPDDVKTSLYQSENLDELVLIRSNFTYQIMNLSDDLFFEEGVYQVKNDSIYLFSGTFSRPRKVKSGIIFSQSTKVGLPTITKSGKFDGQTNHLYLDSTSYSREQISLQALYSVYYEKLQKE